MLSWENATVILGGFATLAIFSFLLGENRFYRFFEHVFIGISAGLLPILTIRDFLWPRVLEPMFGFNIDTFPDGTPSAPYDTAYLFYIAPILFGLLYYTVYSKRLAWLSKLVIGFTLGIGGGLAFKGFFAEVIPQLSGSFKPLVVMKEGGGIDLFTSLSNLLFVATLLIVMYYFFFTFKRRSEKAGATSIAARWMMMICFGAFFGSTVVARLALLVERIEFIFNDFLRAFAVF